MIEFGKAGARSHLQYTGMGNIPQLIYFLKILKMTFMHISCMHLVDCILNIFFLKKQRNISCNFFA